VSRLLGYGVQFLRDGQTYLDTFPADHVRLDAVGRSAGRAQVARVAEA
jgi:hypothetical protein